MKRCISGVQNAERDWAARNALYGGGEADRVWRRSYCGGGRRRGGARAGEDHGWGLPVALSVIERVACCEPVAVGINVMLMEQNLVG